MGAVLEVATCAAGVAMLTRMFTLEAPSKASRPLARDLCCSLAKALYRNNVKFLVGCGLWSGVMGCAPCIRLRVVVRPAHSLPGCFEVKCFKCFGPGCVDATLSRLRPSACVAQHVQSEDSLIVLQMTATSYNEAVKGAELVRQQLDRLDVEGEVRSPDPMHSQRTGGGFAAEATLTFVPFPVSDTASSLDPDPALRPLSTPRLALGRAHG